MSGAGDRRARRLWARLGEERGVTLVEVLVGAIVLVLGASATFGLLAAAAKNAHRAKSSQVVLDLAQEEMERLRAVPYRELVMRSVPTPSANPLDPDSRVSGSSFALVRQPPGEYAPLALIDPEEPVEGIAPTSTFSIGGPSGVKGTIHRYIVWRDDVACGDACPGSEDYKQIVVAVKTAQRGNEPSERGYVEVQSEISDPRLLSEQLPEQVPPPNENEPPPDPDDDGSAQQLFLSDTPCAASPPTVRQPIAGDHLLHNTLGVCADGLQNGTAPGAPDTLLLEPPPDPDIEDEFNPLLYDYADDFYLEPTPDTDRGLQIRRDDTNGCHFEPTGSANPESQIHRWVTDPMPSPFQMIEDVTLEFSTRTLNDALHTGTLCIFLFRRSESGSPPQASDELLVNAESGETYWEYTPDNNGFWPRFGWAQLRLTMPLADTPITIPAGERLGIAIGVERANTQADAIPIMYDHPNHQTRIEVDTDTPLSG